MTTKSQKLDLYFFHMGPERTEKNLNGDTYSEKKTRKKDEWKNSLDVPGMMSG